MQNVIGRLVFIAVVLFFLFDFLPFLFDELEGDFLRHRLAGIVSRLYFDLGRVALEVEIAFGISIGDSFTTGADERGRALHFASRGVSDLGLEAIGIIPLVFIFGLWHFELDGHFAARIQRALALGDHVVSVIA